MQASQRMGLTLMLLAIFMILMGVGAMLASANFKIAPVMAIVTILLFFGGVVFFNTSDDENGAKF